MDKKGFKIGDKVKVVYNSNGSGIVARIMNKIGTVHKPVQFGLIYVEFDEIVYSDLSCIGFYKDEIEKVVTKGEQLLFDFMEGD